MPEDPAIRVPLDTPRPSRSGRSTSGQYSLLAVVLFLINGALIAYSPAWSLCIPLAFLGPSLALIAVAKRVTERRRPRAAQADAAAQRPLPGASRTAFVATVASVLVLHLAAGGNRIWFRLGVEWRLRQVGGLPRVESWTTEHVTSLRQRFDAVGGVNGMQSLNQDERRQFFFVHPPARPPWLQPLTSYLSARVSTDANGRPEGIDFSLGGWDHAWGLSVSADPAVRSDEPPRRWPSRLSARSHLWGQPW